MKHLVETMLPTKTGNFIIRAYPGKYHDFPNLALFTKGYDVKDVVDVRIHSECMTGDLFGSVKCDCGEQLAYPMQWIQQNGGVIVYLRQEGRGIGLTNKLKAYTLQSKGFNTVDANLKLGYHPDSRDYAEAIDILNDLNIKKVRLLTNNPEKLKYFEDTQIKLIDRIPVETEPILENQHYLETKRTEMGISFHR